MYHNYTENIIVPSVKKLQHYTNSSVIGAKFKEVTERTSFYKNCEVIPYNFYLPFFNGKVIRDCGGAFDNQPRTNFNVIRNIKRTINIEHPVFYLDDAWGGNFHHWFWDCIPKIIKFIHLKDQIKDLKLLIYLHIFTEDELKKVLQHSGISWSDVILMDCLYETKYNCKQLYIVNPTASWLSGCFEEKERLQFFELCIKCFKDLSFSNKEKYNKIYISRYENSLKPGGTRKILNIIEVHKFFEYFGYTIVNTDNLSFYERVNFFQNTQCVVAEHGGGCNHLFFTNKHVKWGIIDYYPLSFNQHWLSYSHFNRDVFEIKNVCNLMEDKFIMKYPLTPPINVDIQHVSKPWCIDLYELERQLKDKKMI